MKLGIVIHSNEPETVWNAVRFANFSRQKGDAVKIFLLGRGVEIEELGTENFKVSEQLTAFQESGGGILACGTCLKIREKTGSEICVMSTMADLYALVADSDKVLTF